MSLGGCLRAASSVIDPTRSGPAAGDVRRSVAGAAAALGCRRRPVRCARERVRDPPESLRRTCRRPRDGRARPRRCPSRSGRARRGSRPHADPGAERPEDEVRPDEAEAKTPSARPANPDRIDTGMPFGRTEMTSMATAQTRSRKWPGPARPHVSKRPDAPLEPMTTRAHGMNIPKATRPAPAAVAYPRAWSICAESSPAAVPVVSLAVDPAAAAAGMATAMAATGAGPGGSRKAPAASAARSRQRRRPGRSHERRPRRRRPASTPRPPVRGAGPRRPVGRCDRRRLHRRGGDRGRSVDLGLADRARVHRDRGAAVHARDRSRIPGAAGRRLRQGLGLDAGGRHRGRIRAACSRALAPSDGASLAEALARAATPATDASSVPHDGHERRPSGTDSPQSGQPILRGSTSIHLGPRPARDRAWLHGARPSRGIPVPRSAGRGPPERPLSACDRVHRPGRLAPRADRPGERQPRRPTAR